jgi:hypothetical protein
MNEPGGQNTHGQVADAFAEADAKTNEYLWRCVNAEKKDRSGRSVPTIRKLRGHYRRRGLATLG